VPGAKRARVLVVDDQPAMAEMLSDGLSDAGYDGVAVTHAEAALAEIDRGGVDALVTDLRMPGIDGLDLLGRVRRLDPDLPVLVMTAYGAIDSAIESIRLGAYHYLTKPFKLEELVLFLGRALGERRLRDEAAELRALATSTGDPEIVAASAPMREVLEVVRRVAPADVSVLIFGETGTGKSVIARALHRRSRRAAGPFVTVNCAALPEPLLESELFGHVRGAFTGATRSRAGLVAEAEGGTLFLDEIADMPLALQPKLLDVIERRQVRPVGGEQERAVDVRFVAATHRDLSERVAAGLFREDLRYRLDVVSFEIPALRHRQSDLPGLVERLLASVRARHPDASARRLSPRAYEKLLEYGWPGNVRELAHALERAVLLAAGEEIDASDLPAAVRDAAPRPGVEFGNAVIPIRELQRRYASWAMEQLEGNKKRVCERLGIDPKTLAKWLAQSEGSDS
jgi:two-component system response regulator HydG